MPYTNYEVLIDEHEYELERAEEISAEVHTCTSVFDVNISSALQDRLSVVDSLGERIKNIAHVHPKNNDFKNLRREALLWGEDPENYAHLAPLHW